MAYERIDKPQGRLYHYTRKENLDRILRDGRIRRFMDTECWFCASLEDTLAQMKNTVMKEGKPYYAVGGILKHYPKFVPEDYVILELRPRYHSGEWVRWNYELPPGASSDLVEAARVFRTRNIGYRGDRKFWEEPVVMEVAQLLSQPDQQPGLSM